MLLGGLRMRVYEALYPFSEFFGRFERRDPILRAPFSIFAYSGVQARLIQVGALVVAYYMQYDCLRIICTLSIR